MKVVSGRDSLARGICQKPLFASTCSLLNRVATASWARVSSTLGIGWTSRSTLSLSAFESTQILTSPDFLGTTTIPAHRHTRGWGHRLLKLPLWPPFGSVLWEWAHSSVCRGSAALHHPSVVWCIPPPGFPSPGTCLGIGWEWLGMAGSSAHVALTQQRSWSEVMAGSSPSRLVFSPRTTKMVCLL